MEKVETTIIGNLIFNEDFSRKVLPFVKKDYFENFHEKVIFEEVSDFIVKYKNKKGITHVEMVEIKPHKYVVGPNPQPKRRTKAWMNEVRTFITNQAKWSAAREYCENRGYSFRIITEKELGLTDK